MTIQRTVLFGLASTLVGALTASDADAQCYRSRSITITPSPIVSIYQPRVTYRPHLINPYVQTAEVAPDPAALQFGACQHVDELAARLEVLMNEVCLDLAYNYSHNIDFLATYTEAYQLYQTARFIHASEHNFNREAIVDQLAGADALLCHVKDDLVGWTRNHRRQIGALGINSKMEAAEETLCHLMKDLGVVASPVVEEPPSPDQLSFAPAQ